VKPRPEPENQCVYRGGSWNYSGPPRLRGANRDGYAPWWRTAHIGFRWALDLPKEKKG